jgi:hypothetical protein
MLSDSGILGLHGEWVDMHDIIRPAGLCKNAFTLVPLIALHIISIN